jgi:hypothetical protein
VRWALGGILIVAGVHFLFGIGDSSYFVDEVSSIEHALPAFADIRHLVRETETTPYGYFFLLHGWLYHGGSVDEGAARALSAVAGIGLVGATYWAARAFVERRAALAAAALCAVSPLVLEYAQQARTYVFVMLAATLAVGATARRRLVAGAIAVFAALWLHYTALLVVVPLAVWVALERELPARARALYVAACAVSVATVLPLMVHQYRVIPNGGDLAEADLTLDHAVRVVATPFDGRGGANALRALGALLVLVAVVCAWRRSRLLAVLAAAAPIGLLLSGVLGKEILITRYTAVAAPLMLIALTRLPRLAWPLVGAVLAVGLVDSHGASGRYPPSRETMAYIAGDVRPDDVIVIPAGPGASIPLGYYARRRIDPLPRVARPGEPEIFDGRHRVWVVAEARRPPRDVVAAADAFLGDTRYRAVRGRSFETSTTFVTVLTQPR